MEEAGASRPRPALTLQSIRESLDRLQHRLLIARKEPVIMAVELDQLSTTDPARHIAAGRDAHGLVASRRYPLRPKPAEHELVPTGFCI